MIGSLSKQGHDSQLTCKYPEEERKSESDVNVLFCVGALRIRASDTGVGRLNAETACSVNSDVT